MRRPELQALQAQTDWPVSEPQAAQLLPLLAKVAAEGSAKVTARTEGMLAVLAGLRLAKAASQPLPEVCVDVHAAMYIYIAVSQR